MIEANDSPDDLDWEDVIYAELIVQSGFKEIHFDVTSTRRDFEYNSVIAKSVIIKMEKDFLAGTWKFLNGAQPNKLREEAKLALSTYAICPNGTPCEGVPCKFTRGQEKLLIDMLIDYFKNRVNYIDKNVFDLRTTPIRSPFQWVADPDKIIAAVRRGHASGCALMKSTP